MSVIEDRLDELERWRQNHEIEHEVITEDYEVLLSGYNLHLEELHPEAEHTEWKYCCLGCHKDNCPCYCHKEVNEPDISGWCEKHDSHKKFCIESHPQPSVDKAEVVQPIVKMETKKKADLILRFLDTKGWIRRSIAVEDFASFLERLEVK